MDEGGEGGRTRKIDHQVLSIVQCSNGEVRGMLLHHLSLWKELVMVGLLERAERDNVYHVFIKLSHLCS